MDCSLPGSSLWDSLGKSTGVGCHFLLQKLFLTQGSNPGLPHCRQMLYHLKHQGSSGNLKDTKKSLKVKVTQSCVTLCNPMDCSLPGSSVHGIFQARVLEWRSGLPFPFPGDLPNPGIEPRSPALQADALPSEPPGKP